MSGQSAAAGPRAGGLAPCLRLRSGSSRPGRRLPWAAVSAPAQWFLRGPPCLRLRSGFSRPGRRFAGALSELPPGPLSASGALVVMLLLAFILMTYSFYS